jgi:hypothetical protein
MRTPPCRPYTTHRCGSNPDLDVLQQLVPFPTYTVMHDREVFASIIRQGARSITHQRGFAHLIFFLIFEGLEKISFPPDSISLSQSHSVTLCPRGCCSALLISSHRNNGETLKTFDPVARGTRAPPIRFKESTTPSCDFGRVRFGHFRGDYRTQFLIQCPIVGISSIGAPLEY